MAPTFSLSGQSMREIVDIPKAGIQEGSRIFNTGFCPSILIPSLPLSLSYILSVYLLYMGPAHAKLQ